MTTLPITEDELQKIISALLFSSSVNIVYKNTDPSYQESLKNLAKSLIQNKPSIKLEHIEFIKEDNYEDPWTVDVYENFKDNLEVITFENV